MKVRCIYCDNGTFTPGAIYELQCSVIGNGHFLYPYTINRKLIKTKGLNLAYFRYVTPPGVLSAKKD